MAARKWIKENKVIPMLAPQDLTGQAVDGSTAYLGDAVCMKDYHRLTLIIFSGASWEDAAAVTVRQCTSAALAGEKAVTFTEYFALEGYDGTSDTLTKTTATSNTFNTSADPYWMYIIEITSDMLDADNGFDWVLINMASPGSGTSLGAGLAILSEPRYSSGCKTTEDDDLPEAIT